MIREYFFLRRAPGTVAPIEKQFLIAWWSDSDSPPRWGNRDNAMQMSALEALAYARTWGADAFWPDYVRIWRHVSISITGGRDELVEMAA